MNDSGLQILKFDKDNMVSKPRVCSTPTSTWEGRRLRPQSLCLSVRTIPRLRYSLRSRPTPRTSFPFCRYSRLPFHRSPVWTMAVPRLPPPHWGSLSHQAWEKTTNRWAQLVLITRVNPFYKLRWARSIMKYNIVVSQCKYTLIQNLFDFYWLNYQWSNTILCMRQINPIPRKKVIINGTKQWTASSSTAIQEPEDWNQELVQAAGPDVGPCRRSLGWLWGRRGWRFHL